MKCKTKFKILSFMIFLLTVINVLLGFVKVSPGVNLYYNDEGIYNFIIFIGLAMVSLSSLLNLIFTMFKINDTFKTIFLSAAYCIGSILNIMHYFVVSGNFTRYSSIDNPMLTGLIFCIIISAICIILNIISIIYCKKNEDEIFSNNDEFANEMRRDFVLGVLLTALSFIVVIVGSVIPFNVTSTKKDSFIGYDPSNGFTENNIYSTEYHYTTSAISSPFFWGVLAVFIILTIYFLLRVNNEKYDEDNERKKYFGIGGVLALFIQFQNFSQTGGWTIIFGPGLFIIIALVIVHFASKLFESAQMSKDVLSGYKEK